MNRRLCLFAILPLLNIVSLSAQEGLLPASVMPEVQVSESTAGAFAFEFRPVAWAVDTLREGATARLRFAFADAVFDDRPGAVQIPYKVIVIGIPAGSRVQLEVRPGRFVDTRDVELARAARYEGGEDLGQWLAATAKAETAGFYPAEPVWADEPARYRYQDIVRLQLAPLQYDAATRTVRRYESLTVRVHFIGGKVSAPALTKADLFYDGLLANAATARAFRAPPARRESRWLQSNAAPLYKINVRNEGLYRIDGQFLASKGIALADINPATLQMFNNGGRELPRELNAPRPQGLEEIAILVQDGGDGRFDSNDYILFYGKGVDGFEYDKTTGQATHYLHHYAFDNVYWLTWGATNGKRVSTRQPQPLAGATVVNDFRERFYVEQELRSLFESGLNWYGWLFTSDPVSRSRRYRFTLADVVAGGTSQFKFTFLGGYNTNHHFDIKLNDAALTSVDFFGQYRLRSFSATKVGGLVTGENTLDISYTPSTEIGHAFIDHFELAYDRAVRPLNNSLAFDGRVGFGLYAYQVENSAGLWFFDVSDYRNVALLDQGRMQLSGSAVTFADSAGITMPRRYVISSPNATAINNLNIDAASGWRTPDHSADLVIITHEDFYSEALRLKSLHENWLTNDMRQTEVVKIQDVFDEFSGGLYDPTAIRDFLRYALENWRQAPEFVLLFGDGDHDPKNILDKSDKNWIPTYQTAELDEILSRTTDHWFTYLAGNDAVMDMAIGRIPVRSPQHAKDYVDKFVAYLTQPAFGNWRNTLAFVADDDLVNGMAQYIEQIHINDTEDLSDNYTPQDFNIRKIYLTEYPGVQSASISGVRKPAATEALLRQINNGALVVNYIGHGNPQLWSHERALNFTTDFDKIQNGARQAMWVAATCDFGRFDNPKEQSFSEEVLVAPGRGAIAILSSTRLVYATSNATFNKQYYRALFFADSEVTAPIGLALVQARLRTSATTNDEKFHIFGDPTMRLAVPRHTAQVTRVEPDTIKALSVMTVRGTIQKDGVASNDFDGQVYIETLDSRRTVRYQSASSAVIKYDLAGNTVFRGSAPITDGQFNVQLFVPKDITYGGTRGRINLYFWDADADGNGAVDHLPVGGTVVNFGDQAGPVISIGFAGYEDFVPGGVVGLRPVLKVIIADSGSGINITGEIGHKITLALDGDTENKIDITDLFDYDSGSYTRGVALYPLNDLAEGRHTALVKAWDNFNNSNTASVEFTVMPQDQLALSDVMNYPNPFRSETAFTFVASRTAEVRVKIFTLSGRLICTLEPVAARAGFNAISWNGEDGDGDTLANGVYLYKLIATADDGGAALHAESIGKMVVQR